MTTYEEVARIIGLDASTTQRYVRYMRARWAAEETLQCQVGYAHEWAQRFQAGIEFTASDHVGQTILYSLEAHP